MGVQPGHHYVTLTAPIKRDIISEKTPVQSTAACETLTRVFNGPDYHSSVTGICTIFTRDILPRKTGRMQPKKEKLPWV